MGRRGLFRTLNLLDAAATWCGRVGEKDVVIQDTLGGSRQLSSAFLPVWLPNAGVLFWRDQAWNAQTRHALERGFSAV